MGTTESNSPTTASWYYAKNDQQQGPFRDGELFELIERGVVTPDDLVWRPGFASWRKAAEVQGLYAPPPLHESTASAEASVEPSARESCSLKDSVGDIKFSCPECQGGLAVDASAAGEMDNCPHCGKPIRIPETQARATTGSVLGETELTPPPPTPRSHHGRYLLGRPLHIRVPGTSTQASTPSIEIPRASKDAFKCPRCSLTIPTASSTEETTTVCPHCACVVAIPKNLEVLTATNNLNHPSKEARKTSSQRTQSPEPNASQSSAAHTTDENRPPTKTESAQALTVSRLSRFLILWGVFSLLWLPFQDSHLILTAISGSIAAALVTAFLGWLFTCAMKPTQSALVSSLCVAGLFFALALVGRFYEEKPKQPSGFTMSSSGSK